MTFTKPYLIRLAHCDATGMVFQRAGRGLVLRGARSPARPLPDGKQAVVRDSEARDRILGAEPHGRDGRLLLTVSHLGRTSLRFTMGVDFQGTGRVRMNRVVVCVSQASGKPVALPEELRGRINTFMLG